MYTVSTNIRVRYSETDQMGFVYYGNYAQFFEVARVEALRSLGVRYKDLESSGIWLPVINYSIAYFKPAEYDDLLEIQTSIIELPSARIKFEYTCLNEEGQKICTAKTDLVFLDAAARKPMRCPKQILDSLRTYFN